MYASYLQSTAFLRMVRFHLAFIFSRIEEEGDAAAMYSDIYSLGVPDESIGIGRDRLCGGAPL
jgi:hypothetical protein